MSALTAPGFPEREVRARARSAAGAVFPDRTRYGSALFGQGEHPMPGSPDAIDRIRVVPPVFVPLREERLFELGREPLAGDVDLTTTIGGLRTELPVYVSAFGSTAVVEGDLGVALARQAAASGIPMVIGENIVPVSGYGRLAPESPGPRESQGSLLRRLNEYAKTAADDIGGVIVQQSTEDADAEVWNLVYSDPAAEPLLATGRLAFELKVGQGAKPGLGGMTLVPRRHAARLAAWYDMVEIDPDSADGTGSVLRCATPGTFTPEILRHQIRLMRNNFPRCRVWVKLPPSRDVAAAAEVAWTAGADAVTVDGAEAGTGWAPTGFLQNVGLPLAECLRRIGDRDRRGDLLVSGRCWEGTRVVKCLALGASATGLGRAALVAADEDLDHGLRNLLAALGLELRLLVSALGKYRIADLAAEDVWLPESPRGDR
ncbi:Ferredoxin-dependent glutamate synthase 1 [Nocardia otitidiscaviarum]|uniref:Ferredoxin-dependent glutamate synthase 1 n=1 Tax=Nocardia otitidiscaviarum TaxID=1823 RepID=A0A378YLA9_9NOCA|nr:glutamate synthase-related protein [Nocardia otitidiscaviarum]SUA77975.1 Ferredoxin-dependent glutamate synthase 1 [Nocardia otitidiscaviarum]